MSIKYQEILQEIHEEIKPFKGEGQIATYIPELATVDPDKYGICLHCFDGQEYTLGDYEEKFSIQSISKVLTLSLAVSKIGERIWERVDVEPSGDPFNSLVQLEYEQGIPRNPLINSGAIVVADILVSILDDPKEDFLKFIRSICGNESINFNPKVAASEKATGFRNAALANMLKSFDNIKNDVDTVLDFYFHQCSLEMTCQELSRTFLLFANHGTQYGGTEQILPRRLGKRINAIMQTCGFYDEAGEFSFRVGLPGKSGVGGGIAAIYPQQYSVAVWSPRLNPKGNSVLGMKSLELLTTKTGYSIF
ncbi:glutaminase [Agaribacillus aureus]|uniref:glutaminase n=1 Tax=Agaribacillus aureus TaxID=3051825 RepID=UPI003211BECE